MTRTILDVLRSSGLAVSDADLAEEIAHAAREALAKRRAETLRGPRTIKTDYHFSGFGL